MVLQNMEVIKQMVRISRRIREDSRKEGNRQTVTKEMEATAAYMVRIAPYFYSKEELIPKSCNSFSYDVAYTEIWHLTNAAKTKKLYCNKEIMLSMLCRYCGINAWCLWFIHRQTLELECRVTYKLTSFKKGGQIKSFWHHWIRNKFRWNAQCDKRTITPRCKSWYTVTVFQACPHHTVGFETCWLLLLGQCTLSHCKYPVNIRPDNIGLH